jgi:hypothetical protein
MPSTVSPDRSLLAPIPRRAKRTVSSADVLDDESVDQPDQAVRVRCHLVLVRDEHDGPTRAVQPVEHGEELVGRPGVEVSGRLVGQDQCRRPDQCASHSDPLLLAPGKLVRLMVGPIVQPDKLQGGAGPRAALGRPQTGIGQR